MGAFILPPIESRHFQFPAPVMREQALAPPNCGSARSTCSNLRLQFSARSTYSKLTPPTGGSRIQGSAGLIENGLEGFNADAVFLGVGGLGSQTTEYRATSWRETIEGVQPKRFIPIHWDSLTGPI